MTHATSAALLLGMFALSTPSIAQEAMLEDITPKLPSFTKPERLKAAGEFIRVENPGYAAPCLHDVNGDGHADLVVGQFRGGKIQVFHGQEGGGFGKGQWLEASGQVAEVPGVW